MLILFLNKSIGAGATAVESRVENISNAGLLLVTDYFYTVVLLLLLS